MELPPLKEMCRQKITPLIKDGRKLLDNAPSLNQSTDSRICPEAYKLIIEGTAEVSEGKKDAEILLNEADIRER